MDWNEVIDSTRARLDRQPLQAESWHDIFSGAFVIARRSPELHPAEGGRGFSFDATSPAFAIPACLAEATERPASWELPDLQN
jgi:hypothetical protein